MGSVITREATVTAASVHRAQPWRHAAAQILAGIKMGVPVLVLIRRPEEAVPSLAARRHFGGVEGFFEQAEHGAMNAPNRGS